MKRMDWLWVIPKWFAGYVVSVVVGLVTIAWYTVALPILSLVQVTRLLFGSRLAEQIQEQDEKRIYYSKNHLRLEKTQQAILTGPDKLMLRLIGKVDRVSSASQGQTVAPGSPLIDLQFQDKSLRFASPIAGRIVDVNTLILRHPELLTTMDPAYLWIVRIQPEKPDNATISLIPNKSFDRLAEAFRNKLVDFFAAQRAQVMQDGGIITPGLARDLSKKQWDALIDAIMSA